jgi:hypothetical protein
MRGVSSERWEQLAGALAPGYAHSKAFSVGNRKYLACVALAVYAV